MFAMTRRDSPAWARSVALLVAAIALPLALAIATESCAPRKPAVGTTRDRLPACVVPAQPDPLSERGKRVHQLATQLGQTYSALHPGAARAEDLADGALAALVIADDTVAAESLLRELGQRQITDGSDARGRFTADPGDARGASELGAVTLPLAALLTKLHGCLASPFRRELDVTVSLAIEALRRDADRVKTGATRTWLSESVSLALLGQAQGDVAAAAQGQEQLDAWRKTASVHGIAEHAAADGYAADLDALLLGDAYLEDRAARTLCHEAAQLFFRDLAAHWFPSHAAMAGPTSRAPSSEGGEVRTVAALAGWLEATPAPASPATVPLRRVLTLLAALDTPQLPDEEARTVFARAEREVTALWEDPDKRAPGRQSYTFLTRDIALGATSAAASREVPRGAEGADRAIDAELADPAARPASLTVHVGNVRLEPTVSAAQDGGALLVMVAAPAVAAGTAGEIRTELALPLVASGELVVEGRRGPPSPEDGQLAFGTVLGTRAGAGGIAVQIAGASGCHGVPRVELQRDPAAGLARVRIVHGDASRGACRARLSLLFVAGHADSHAALAALMESAKSPVTERAQDPTEPGAAPGTSVVHGASVKIDRGALQGISAVSLAVERRSKIVGGSEVDTVVSRRANGKPMHFGVLELDGTSVSPFDH